MLSNRSTASPSKGELKQSRPRSRARSSRRSWPTWHASLYDGCASYRRCNLGAFAPQRQVRGVQP